MVEKCQIKEHQKLRKIPITLSENGLLYYLSNAKQSETYEDDNSGLVVCYNNVDKKVRILKKW